MLTSFSGETSNLDPFFLPTSPFYNPGGILPFQMICPRRVSWCPQPSFWSWISFLRCQLSPLWPSLSRYYRQASLLRILHCSVPKIPRAVFSVSVEVCCIQCTNLSGFCLIWVRAIFGFLTWTVCSQVGFWVLWILWNQADFAKPD